MTEETVTKAADFVLGLIELSPEERAAPEMSAAIRFWETHLSALNGGVEMASSDDLWNRIEDKIDELSDAPGTRTIPPEDGIWETIAEGIDRKVVYVDRDRDVQGFFIRMKAGAILPTHTHALDEHCVVLSGRLRVGHKEFGMGTYHLAERDTDHLALMAVEDTEFFILGAL